MQQPSRHLLAYPSRPRQKYAASSRRYSFECRPDSVDRARCPGQFIFKAYLGTKALVFATQPLGLGGATDQVKQALCFKRLFDKICSAPAHRRNCSVKVAMA